MLVGRKYKLMLTSEQEEMIEEWGGICRAVWNTALEQRREYRRRGAWMSFFAQTIELVEAKREFEWLAIPPAKVLEQTLMDLDRACRQHGTFKVGWRSKNRWSPSLRFPSSGRMKVQRLGRRWAQVKLIKIGMVKFRWTRPLGGEIRSATVTRKGGHWWISFLVEDGPLDTPPNEGPPIGVDLGVQVTVATSDGWTRSRKNITAGEAERERRLQRQLRRCTPGSNRRREARVKLGKLRARPRCRRQDFNAWTANRLTRDYGLVAFEDLPIIKMVASAKGTIDEPGRNVRQKAGLNRVILDRAWGDLVRRVEYKSIINGSRVVRVPAAYTSQTCSACGHCASENRKSQAVFQCATCGHRDNADINAAKNILAAGLAVTGRGDLGVARSTKRQPAADGRLASAPSEVTPDIRGEANCTMPGTLDPAGTATFG